eukprot:GILI01005632.1.p1 GENE.GILI01005632.1~~GILI01005632.1.p1  ORF type:complete len:411 (+),score=94.72 GILI01005632.1:79-1233(+)
MATTAALPRHPEAHPNGGLNLKDEENTRAIILDVLKKIGKGIKEGSFDAMKISRPARISHASSYLEAVAKDFRYIPVFLKRAAQTSDPVERMKLVITLVLAGLHINATSCRTKAPLNPILGETYQAGFADGTSIYCEQISHHPPVSSWQIVAPDDSFQFIGYGEVNATIRVNKVRGWRTGKNIVKFANYPPITFTNPELKVSGIMYGERIFNFCKSVQFHDEANNLVGEVTFNPDDPGMVMGLVSALTGWWSSSKKKEKEQQHVPSDFCRIQIYQTGGAEKVAVASGTGSWLSHVEFGGTTYWSITQNPEEIIPAADPLPSDCRFREDLQFLKNGDYENAQIHKERLENAQRMDARRRKAKGGAPTPLGDETPMASSSSSSSSS